MASSPSSVLPLRRQWLPLPTGNHPAKGRPPLRFASSPLLASGLAAGVPPDGYRPCGLVAASRAHRRRPTIGVGLPCRLALAVAGRPLARGLGRSLAMGGRPYTGAGHPSSSLRKRSKNA
ncbi:hypothetical protein B296_00000270 [Ensete ventricosum]|uniref:Uncharacterized protein n=1 Tax=Ensete ventricosum TaxID=4639 RepID=A0A427ARW7_ENSVE|nr:hypothetical protein B296_00000270 [Ensete ventricosum]